MGATGDRRERRDVRENMERVLRAAHDLFARHGPEVKMEEVARRAGVGVGTIYRRFPSKELLFAAVSAAVCQDTRHCLIEAAADEADPLERLRAIITVQYRQSAQQAALLDLNPATEQTADNPGLYAALHTLIERAVSDGQRQGRIRPGDPAMLAAICLELLSPRTVQHLTRLTHGCAEDAAEHVARFILAGLAEQPLTHEA